MCSERSVRLDLETRDTGRIQNVEQIAVNGDADRLCSARVGLADKS
jgi:hypothetical protein